MRNYDVKFDYSGLYVNPSSADGDTTPANSITFSVGLIAPTGVAIQNGLGEMPPYSVGGWAIWGIVLESIAFIGISGFVVFWCVKRKSMGTVSDKDQDQSAGASQKK